MPIVNAAITLKDNTVFSGSLTPQQSVTVDASALPGALQSLTIAPSAEIHDNKETESLATGWRMLDSAGIRISVTCFNKLLSCGFSAEATISYDENTGCVSKFELDELSKHHRAFFARSSTVQEVAGAIIQQRALMGSILKQVTQIAARLEHHDVQDGKKVNGKDQSTVAKTQGVSSQESDCE